MDLALPTGAVLGLVADRPWAPIALLLIQAATVVVIPVPAGPVTVLNTVLFGPWAGFGNSLAGTVVGSTAAFLLGRRYGGPLLRRIASERALNRYDGRLATSDGMWLLPVLSVPVPVGGDLACFVAGLCSVRTRRFVAVVTAGRVPGTALGVLMATGVSRGSVVWLGAGLVVLAVLATLARYRRRPATAPDPVLRQPVA